MAESSYNPGDRILLTFKGVLFAFRYCPPDVFFMGSSDFERGRTDWERRRQITLTEGFYILESPVTQEQQRAVMGNNPSERQGDRLPVESVSWFDCQDFLAHFNALGIASQSCQADLPTEAQWEYACRAGTTSAYYCGETLGAGT
ncbi:MAG: SUMF1/EgtB/PvdO family nonheme iron enzyme, partial [Thermoguttaceae bacterium]|nr:SUMF1/EgtB/PvdO family nonheme iron enzyme [Thermoguttaceae bacterium]